MYRLVSYEFTATNEDVDVEDMTVVHLTKWYKVGVECRSGQSIITLDSIPAEIDEFVIGDCTVTW
jgi:hypothetical protein